MAGSIEYREDRGTYRVYFMGKRFSRYKGEIIYHRKIANKLLSLMQSDVENDTFRPEKYQKPAWTDVIPYLEAWVEGVVKDTCSPATYKDYNNSIKNHLAPFFRDNPFQLHEIQLDVLTKLLNSINRVGKGKQSVMYCLHACMDYAWRSQRIPAIPPFPRKREYQIVEPVIRWLPEARQMRLIDAIEPEHQPIFWWLKYHVRRIAEAEALHKEDYDADQDTFTVRRSISNRQLVSRTKTGAVHVIPCHDSFRVCFESIPRGFGPYFFTCESSRQRDKQYTWRIMDDAWKRACKLTGEDIGMYQGLKHSSVCQFLNEKGLSVSEVQVITGHKDIRSVLRYGETTIARKRELMETVVKIGKRRKNERANRKNNVNDGA